MIEFRNVTILCNIFSGFFMFIHWLFIILLFSFHILLLHRFVFVFYFLVFFWNGKQQQKSKKFPIYICELLLFDMRKKKRKFPSLREVDHIKFDVEKFVHKIQFIVRSMKLFHYRLCIYTLLHTYTLTYQVPTLLLLSVTWKTIYIEYLRNSIPYIGTLSSQKKTVDKSK